jgi:N-acetylglucosamine malate deacetylase 1
MKILIIGAHPDDEVLGCGGTVRKYSKQGAEIYSLILTQGKKIRERDGVATDIVGASKKCAEILGIKKTFTRDMPVVGMDSIPLVGIVREIEQVINEVQPETVFTHHEGDTNQDHSAVARATSIATRPKVTCVRGVYAYEIPSSTDWITQKDNIFVPNVFVDIENEIQEKIDAFKQYHSEVEGWPHSRSEEGIKALAAYRGMQSFNKYAEAFHLIKRHEL